MVRSRPCDVEYLIEKSLSGPPSDWSLIIKNLVTVLESFAEKFQQRYWNEHTQHEIRKKLEFGYFQITKDKSRAEYATKTFANVNELTPALEPREVIRKLTRYFGDEIKYAIVGKGISHSE